MDGPAATLRDAKRPERLSALFLAPVLPWAWPAIVALTATSEVPRILGRWSLSFFGFNVLQVVVLGLLFVAWRRGRLGLLLTAYAGLVLLTVVAPMNNALRALPGFAWLMPLTRLATGAAAALAGFEHLRRHGRPLGPALAAGCALVALSVLDLALLVFVAATPDRRADDTGLRETYALERIGVGDVVLVGDSFVWGQGVAKEERFGDVLQALYDRDARPTRVYSLGQRGWGLLQYQEALAALPAEAVADRVVLALYMNDMPFHETWRGKIQDAGTALGRGIPTARLFGDKLARLLTPDVDAYHAFVVRSWDPGHPTWAARWALFEERLGALHRLAAAHSRRPPLVLILPLMVDFADYPLETAHARLAAGAAAAGFEVLDLLPPFRAELGNGSAHRNDPADNHFDAATHARVARLLRERL